MTEVSTGVISTKFPTQPPFLSESYPPAAVLNWMFLNIDAPQDQINVSNRAITIVTIG